MYTFLLYRIEEALYKKSLFYYSNKIHTTKAHRVCTQSYLHTCTLVNQSTTIPNTFWLCKICILC